MNAPPSNTTVSLMPDAHAYLMLNSLQIASSGGVVAFQPLASMSPDQVAAVASQIIATCERWRDANLERDALLTRDLLARTRGDK